MDEAKLSRGGLLGGVGFVVLSVVAALIAGTPPKITDDKGIIKYFADNQDALKIGSYLNGLAAVLFLWFLGSLYSRLRAAEGGTGRLSRVAVTGAVVAIAISAIANAEMAYSAIHPSLDHVPAAYKMASVLLGYTAFAAAVFTSATAVALWSTKTLPKWFAYAGEVIAVLWLVAGAAVSTERDIVFTVGFVAFVAFSIWVALLSVMLYRKEA
ncbi:MAG: hypothetical protein EXQ79_03975 [Acidimicrobiia bacterium]|nr:hypothetical protein [Acidimicrobiia bacterium]